jgi:UDP-N-acetylmuramoyl-L-alanyl-D-glutamate--2,6-diaminopimelate ligase
MAEIKSGIQPLGTREYGVEELSGGFAEKGFVLVESRRQAIRLAVRLAGPGDIVLLAGKGHEVYQIFGTEKFHFDDREEAGAALKDEG